MKIYKKIIFIFLILGTITACSDDPCKMDTESILTLEIKVEDADLISSKFAEGLSVYVQEWTDSIAYADEKIDSIILSPNDTLTTLILTSANETLKDTLFIYHKNQVRLLSMECGFVVDYEIDTVINTWNLIDSISVVEEEITNDENGLIEIYYL